MNAFEKWKQELTEKVAPLLFKRYTTEGDCERCPALEGCTIFIDCEEHFAQWANTPVSQTVMTNFEKLAADVDKMTPDVIELLDRHPSIHYTGSVEGMKKLGYWGEDDVCARIGDYIYNLSVYIGKDKFDSVYELLAEMFDAPCNFTFNGEDVAEFMTTVGGDWCDKNCGDMPSYANCWREYMRLMLEGKAIENCLETETKEG